MVDETINKKGGMLGEELLKELKTFLIEKPGGYQFTTQFARAAVREKIDRMKAEGTQ